MIRRDLLDKLVRLRVPVFSATDRMEAGTIGRVFSVWTYKDGSQSVGVVTGDPGSSIRIEEIAIDKVELARG